MTHEYPVILCVKFGVSTSLVEARNQTGRRRWSDYHYYYYYICTYNYYICTYYYYICTYNYYICTYNYYICTYNYYICTYNYYNCTYNYYNYNIGAQYVLRSRLQRLGGVCPRQRTQLRQHPGRGVLACR